MSLLLAADIGGTFSRFALFRLEEGGAGTAAACSLPEAEAKRQPGAQTVYRLGIIPESRLKLSTKDFTSFGSLLEHLGGVASFEGRSLHDLAAQKLLNAAVMAVPGPVQDGRCIAANIPWLLDEHEIEAAFKVPARLVNDFAAQGHACLFPQSLGLKSVLSGISKPGYPLAVLGAGTGLGCAILLPEAESGGLSSSQVGPGPSEETNAATQQAHGQTVQGAEVVERVAAIDIQASCLGARAALPGRVLPSEGGHAVFSFRGEEEAAFEAFMRKLTGRREVIGDMAVTGHGLAALFAYHTGADKMLAPHEVTPLLAQSPETVEWFARFYGRACRNFVLSTLGLGGVYLSGGMLSHVPGLLGHPAFAAEFRFSETKEYLMKEVPVSWVSNPDAGLWGSAVFGLRFLEV